MNNLLDGLMPPIDGGDGTDGSATVTGMARRTIDDPLSRYSPFGDLAQQFKGEGWMPERYNNEFTEYRAGTDLLNSIDLPNGKGYFSIKMNNKSGSGDLYIKDKDGKVVQTLYTNVPAKMISDYFSNKTSQDNYGNKKGSVINQRINNLVAADKQVPQTSLGASILGQ